MNNKGADQPAHQSRLISAFVIRVMESIISKYATRERISSDKASNLPKRDGRFILLK